VTFLIIAPYKYSYLLTYLLTYFRSTDTVVEVQCVCSRHVTGACCQRCVAVIILLMFLTF